MTTVRVVVSGYTSIDTRFVTAALPNAGETAVLEGDVLPPPRWGGCAPNVAIWLERLGVHAGLAGWLGGDEEGRLYRSVLADAGVDLRALETGSGPSPRAWLVHDASGEAICLFHPSGSADQTAEATEPLVAVCSYFNPVVLVRDLRTGAVRTTLPHPQGTYSCAWQPGGGCSASRFRYREPMKDHRQRSRSLESNR